MCQEIFVANADDVMTCRWGVA